MNKLFKKALSVFLAVLCIATVFVPSISAASNDLPIVYVVGKNSHIFDKDEKKIYPPSKSLASIIEDNAANLSIVFQACMISGNWENYSNAIYNMVAPQYKNFVLNEDGEIANGTHIKPNAEPKKKKSGFALTDYMFSYDCRIDPFENAKNLYEFINKVLKATGKTKVNLIGRCLGTTVMSAYLQKYGKKKQIESCIFYASSAQGCQPLSGFFSGSVEFDPDALHYYASHDLAEDQEFSDFVRGIIALSYQTNLFSTGAMSVASIYNKVAKTLFPRLVLAVYGTCPGYWTMISDEYYEKAKDCTFKGEKEKYKNLIAKIDNYHNNVYKKLPEILNSCVKNGMKFSVISKYNLAMPPLFPDCMQQADNLIEIKGASLGAKSALIGETFTTSYIRFLENSGRDKYLSPDLKIDASFCLYPDSTWFIKDLAHEALPKSADALIMEIFHSPTQYTINSNSKYPQFLQYSSETEQLTPVTGPDAETPLNPSFIPTGKWIRQFFKKIKELLSVLFKAFK